MTPEQTLNARADAVAEILTGRHPEHEQLALAINRARNAVQAGYSAHSALERGEAWIREAEVLTSKALRTDPSDMLLSIPGTKVHSLVTVPGKSRAEITDYHTGRRVVVRVEDLPRVDLQRVLHGIDGGAA